MFIFLLLIYPLAIQYKRGGAWCVLYPLALVALILDVASNYTEMWVIFWDAPEHGEYTISQRIARYMRISDYRGRFILCFEWRYRLARPIAAYLNFFSNGHIPNYPCPQ